MSCWTISLKSKDIHFNTTWNKWIFGIFAWKVTQKNQKFDAQEAESVKLSQHKPALDKSETPKKVILHDHQSVI